MINHYPSLLISYLRGRPRYFNLLTLSKFLGRPCIILIRCCLVRSLCGGVRLCQVRFGKDETAHSLMVKQSAVARYISVRFWVSGFVVERGAVGSGVVI